MKDYKYVINGKEVKVTIGDIDGNIANVEVNGDSYKVEMEKKEEAPKPKVVVKKPKAETSSDSAAPAAKSSVGNASVKSPLPGVVTEVKVNVGDVVKKGETVVILEAMKMANSIGADKDGKVTAICVSAGDSVMAGDNLVAIE
ncbi:MAG: biotin/lipoyl-binding protein [Bacteroidaceae bacterium]|nr:biotin/lipoyl-binding protein [Bacteroidaceae bacterium]